MKTRFLVLLAFLFSLPALAQDCGDFKVKAGTGFELLSYNARDKMNGRLVYTFKNIRREGGSTVMDVVMNTFDEKGKGTGEYTLHYLCNGNEIIADLSPMVQQNNPAMKNMEMKMKVNELAYPTRFTVGQKLKDGRLEAEMFNNGSKMMDMNLLMANRQVESRESLTIPAGTYNAFKLNSDMNIENRTMGIPIKMTMKTVSYRVEDVLFDLKTETYRNGKLIGYTVLNKIL
ncbi:TapB family protein [Tellurirhabdus rosea]|uniref:TapB family protein n=1 Tax=Tellurirhabdus rosea TaxID=2674997 RepID=UPI00224FDEF9|nr:hypothetical protein [Tellurirhabdus rosea]